MWLKGQFIPKDLPKRRDVIFIGEKPSLYFIRHPKERYKGNYNATSTDFVFQNWIRKYLKQGVFVTDMVKTEGKAGASFEREWRKDNRFRRKLFEELRTYKPKIIVIMSNKAKELFLSDPQFLHWRTRAHKIYHPSHVARFRKFDEWDMQFSEIVKNL